MVTIWYQNQELWTNCYLCSSLFRRLIRKIMDKVISNLRFLSRCLERLYICKADQTENGKGSRQPRRQQNRNNEHVTDDAAPFIPRYAKSDLTILVVLWIPFLGSVTVNIFSDIKSLMKRKSPWLFPFGREAQLWFLKLEIDRPALTWHEFKYLPSTISTPWSEVKN